MKGNLDRRKFINPYGFRNYIKSVRLFSVMILVFTLMLTGCKAKAEAKVSNQYSYSFTDSLDNEINLVSAPQRVVSCVGSYAETWILAGGSLVGVTNDVISERGMDLPSETNIIGTIKEPNAEEIIALSPDFVILSPDIESHVKIAELLKQSNIPYAFFKVEHFEDYLNMLNICTDITGNKDLYEKNGLDVKKQIDGVLSRIDDNTHPNILFIRAFSSGTRIGKQFWCISYGCICSSSEN
jgi:iron complex transport system substrate-binding protein